MLLLSGIKKRKKRVNNRTKKIEKTFEMKKSFK